MGVFTRKRRSARVDDSVTYRNACRSSPFAVPCPVCGAARWWPCTIPGTIPIRVSGSHRQRKVETSHEEDFNGVLP